MHYKLKPEKRAELQQGRTLKYIAEGCGYTRQFITYVFNGKMNATHESAYRILDFFASESVDLSNKTKKYGWEYLLNYFFEEVE